MIPTTALKQIVQVKKHIAALEIELLCSDSRQEEDNNSTRQELNELRKLLQGYEEELKDWNTI